MKNHQRAGGGDEDREGGHNDGEEGFLHRRQRCLAASVPKSMAGERFALPSEEVAPRSAAGPIRSKSPLPTTVRGRDCYAVLAELRSSG
jgi:hypothetical protein